ncbi:hypothetical protein WMZ97_01395 [Lentibacillus sp. N15]|uniref:hypothetical protein n=1 Tax=Lentibacillus songyuanensis TaxID=3136161 RepID=UPI0031BAF328
MNNDGNNEMNNEWYMPAAMPVQQGNAFTAMPDPQANPQEEMRGAVYGHPGFEDDFARQYGVGPFLGGLAGGLLTGYLLFPHGGGYPYYGYYPYYQPYYPHYYGGFFW